MTDTHEDCPHEWRLGYLYQEPQEQSPITGAPAVPPKAYARFFCVYCLEERDRECRTPLLPGVNILNNVLLQGVSGPVR